MQRKRDELVPIGDALSGMGSPVQALRDASPQARHHFTRFDQVNLLVSASEADADLGFMARLLTLCSLPRTNPGKPRIPVIPETLSQSGDQTRSPSRPLATAAPLHRR